MDLDSHTLLNFIWAFTGFFTGFGVAVITFPFEGPWRLNGGT